MTDKKIFLSLISYLIIYFSLVSPFSARAGDVPDTLLNEPIDVSRDFRDFTNTYFLADRLVDFDPAKATGKIACAGRSTP